MVTPLTFRDIYWSLTISCRISSSGSKTSNWSCTTLTFMWCFMLNFPQFYSWGKAQYPQTLQILCNTSHKGLHQIILNSRTLDLIQILRWIPAKPQVTSRVLLQKIIITCSCCCSPYLTYKKLWPERESLSLDWSNVQLTRYSKTHQI